MPKLYFDLVGPQHDTWVWTLVDSSGAVAQRSESRFRYYLDALNDARKNGLQHEASFRVMDDVPGIVLDERHKNLAC